MKKLLIIISIITAAFSIEKVKGQNNGEGSHEVVVHSEAHSRAKAEESHFTKSSHEVIAASHHEFPHNYSSSLATANWIAHDIHTHENANGTAQYKTNTKAFDKRNAQTQIASKRQIVSHTTSHGIDEAVNLEKRYAKLNKTDRSGKDFTKAGKDVVKELNTIKNNGKMRCENCKVELQQALKHQKGVTPPGNEAQVDHIIRKRHRGRGNPDNGRLFCRKCNIKRR